VLYADPSRPRAAESEWVELVRRVAAGDERALQALYARAHRMVYTLGVRITGNRETAEEVTADVFHGVWQRAASYDPANGTVVGWIMNQARSRAIDRVRFEQRQKRVDPRAGALPSDGPSVEPDSELDLLEQGRLLQRALERLSAVEKQAIETAFFSGLSYSQTAAKLQLPLGTVKTRIRTGLDKLRQVLNGRMAT
jgi:RNA polymerase sigma-70 factor (ECF subfamily)